MDASSKREITGLLRAFSAGNERSLQPLISQVCAELRRGAHPCMAAERDGHTLQTTALMHEVYLRLVDLKQVEWKDRAHFMAVCAQFMRRVLVDFARSKRFQKRRGGAAPLSLDEVAVVAPQPQQDIVALDDALTRLRALGTKGRARSSNCAPSAA